MTEDTKAAPHSDDPRDSSSDGTGGAGGTDAVPPARKYLVHRKDQVLIGGITVGIGSFVAPRWDGRNRARGWVISGADIGPSGGYIFGAIWYRHQSDGRTVRVGCRWNVDTATYECVALHPTDPVEDSALESADREALLLDARSRIGHLHRICLEIAANVLTDTSNQALLDAAGFGTDTTITHDTDPDPDAEDNTDSTSAGGV